MVEVIYVSPFVALRIVNPSYRRISGQSLSPPARLGTCLRQPNVLKMRRSAGVCLWMAALTLAPVPAAFADQASKLYKEGRKAERSGEMARAYLLYSQAAA